MEKELIALFIFGFTYLLIAARRFRVLHIGRAAGALVGATLMVVFGVISIDGAYKSIDLNTIVLLFGMMVISEYLRLAGFFRGVATVFIKNISSPKDFLTAVVWISGIGSAFLVNDTVCIIMTPIILAYAVSAEVDALPFLIALATSSNIGSMGTLAGNPQNMLIGSYARLSYSKYFIIVFPLALLILYFNNILLKKVFEKRLCCGAGTLPKIPEFRIKKNLMIKERPRAESSRIFSSRHPGIKFFRIWKTALRATIE
ncbi:MAG: SLC13 family permease, partial [Acidobacteria bacterium]|nr:SLC13 family permease [Acidobacteriota bacterium]